MCTSLLIKPQQALWYLSACGGVACDDLPHGHCTNTCVPQQVQLAPCPTLLIPLKLHFSPFCHPWCYKLLRALSPPANTEILRVDICCGLCLCHLSELLLNSRPQHILNSQTKKFQGSDYVLEDTLLEASSQRNSKLGN